MFVLQREGRLHKHLCRSWYIDISPIVLWEQYFLPSEDSLSSKKCEVCTRLCSMSKDKNFIYQQLISSSEDRQKSSFILRNTLENPQ